jgi:glycosyltransferase involved in cell wall biosynthesis
MNILEICSGTYVNGAIVHCLLLSRELARRGHRVTVVCRGESWLARQLAADVVEPVWSSLRRWPSDELRRIADVARTRQIEVIHTHLSSGHYFGILLHFLTGIPCVATAQSRHFQLHWMFNDYVVAVSEATRRYQHWCNFVSPVRLETIHNFIDLRGAAAVPADARSRLRASLAVDDSSELIGAVGDVVRRKGLIYLVGALPQILRAVPDAWLVVVGPQKPGGYADQVKMEADRLGVASRILWTGRRDNVYEILAALDLTVLASLEESLPLAVLEAMAAGLPVVATRVGGIPECVKDGETGILVPPANSQALAAAITRLLQDPAQRRQFGAAGRRYVHEHFSPESQIVRIEEVFARVIRQRKAA